MGKRIGNRSSSAVRTVEINGKFVTFGGLKYYRYTAYGRVLRSYREIAEAVAHKLRIVEFDKFMEVEKVLNYDTASFEKI